MRCNRRPASMPTLTVSDSPPSIPAMHNTSSETIPAARRRGRLSRESQRMLLFGLAIAAVLVALHATPLRHQVTDFQSWKQALRDTGAAAPLVFFALNVLAVAVGVPRLALCAIAGMLFGFDRGVCPAHFGALAGSYLTFLFARWGGRGWVQRRLQRHTRLHGLFQHPTTLGIVLVRQMPVAGIVINLLLGMTNVRQRVFITGSFLGLLPGSLAATLVGSGLGKTTWTQAAMQIGVAMLVLALAAWLAFLARRRMNRE